MQTSREVIDGLLRQRPVERMGFYDLPWVDTLQLWTREEGYPADDAGEPQAPVDVFGIDMAPCGGWFDLMPLRGHSEVLEETDEWRVTRNGAGAALKYWKHKSGTPEHVDFRMSSREVWDRDYRSHLLEFDPQRLDVEATRKNLLTRREQGYWTYYGNIFIWEMLRCSLGDIGMFESLALDPEWIHDYNRVYTDFYKAHYRVLLEQAGRPDGIWIYEDLGFSKGLFCSPRMLEELVFPYYCEMVEFFAGYDLPVILHSCGGVTDAVPMVIDAGFAALNPMEAKAGCDVVGLARQYGDRLAFVGGMDARIFESGDRAAIKAEVCRITSAMKSVGGRYTWGSDHSISPNVRLADFRYALEVFRDHMYY